MAQPLPPEPWNLMQVSSTPQIRALLRRARGEDGASPEEQDWARRQLEWMHSQILAEKQALSRTFSTLVGVFWGISMYVVVQQPKRREIWAMLPITAVFPLSIYVRIWVCNWLAHEFWTSRPHAGR